MKNLVSNTIAVLDSVPNVTVRGGGSDMSIAENAVVVKECADNLIVMEEDMKNDRGPDNPENEEPMNEVEVDRTPGDGGGG